jgi:uncharacterized repeat protein (TIGR03803 family)
MVLKHYCELLMLGLRRKSRAEWTGRAWAAWRTSASRALVAFVGVSWAVAAHGAGFTLLHGFGGGHSDGGSPAASLIFDSLGDLYGTTTTGGRGDGGTVFKVKTDGTGFAILHSFRGEASDGANPRASLVLDSSGNLYGTTPVGGGARAPSGDGIVFKVKVDGTDWTVLHSFGGGASDGARPNGSLVLDSSGNLYGTTGGGGASNDGGTLFKVRIDGTHFSVLHSFLERESCWFSLILDSSGYLYGITLGGGQWGRGTVFKVKTDGTGYTILHSFDIRDNELPAASLILDAGYLYGTTMGIMGNVNGTVFKIKVDGTGFSVLHRFAREISDQGPNASLFLDSAGNLYGTTGSRSGGSTGAVFRVTTDGKSFTLLHHFIGLPSYGTGLSSLIQDSSGNLYGTTEIGGPSLLGTVFKINIQEATSPAATAAENFREEEVRGDALERDGKHRDALASYVSALRKSNERIQESDEDRRLREKIIGIVVKLDPPPVIPEEAERFMVRGRAAIEAAKTPVEFERAALEFQNALREAPWWADAYFNLGTVQEKAGQTALAVESFKRYLLAAPNARDAREVKDQIYRLEYKEELAEKERQEVVQRRAEEDRRREAERSQWEARRQNLAGVWKSDFSVYPLVYLHKITVEGTTVEIGEGHCEWKGHNVGGVSFRGTVEGRNITGTTSEDMTSFRNGSVFKRPFTAVISEDGNTIEINYGYVGPMGSDKNGYALEWREFQSKRVLTRSQ